MARQSKKLVDNIVDLFRKANTSERQKWQTDSQKSYEFFLGEQLSAQEKEDLQSGGMPDFVINRITPVIEMMKFFATANNPRWQAVGSEGSDSDVAALHSDIADYCWYNSNGNSIYSSVIQDALVKGIGYMQVDVDPDQDRGMGEVVFNSVNPFDVYIDPTSRDFLFRDASYVIVKKDMPKEQLVGLFPDDKRKINSAQPSNLSNNDYSQRDVVDSEIIFNADVRSSAYTKEGEDDEIIDYYEGLLI